MSGCQFCFVHSISPPSRLNMMHFCLLVSYAVGREASVAVSLLNQDLIKHRIHDDALSSPCIRSDRPLFISEFGASASDTMQRSAFWLEIRNRTGGSAWLAFLLLPPRLVSQLDLAVQNDEALWSSVENNVWSSVGNNVGTWTGNCLACSGFAGAASHLLCILHWALLCSDSVYSIFNFVL